MSRFSYYDTDEERLPEGMRRVGYDADTQVYTFRDDTDGSLWEGAPGATYGQLTRVSGPSQQSTSEEEQPSGPSEPFLVAHTPEQRRSWRHEHMPLLNFFMIVALFLVGVFWFMGFSLNPKPACDGGPTHTVQTGDTCWAIADSKGISVEDLISLNEGLNCDHLAVGQAVCLPRKP